MTTATKGQRRDTLDGSSEPFVTVVVFPGSNDDRDALNAVRHLGGNAVRVWHAEPALPAGTRAVILPGGFSYGDYLRCGAIARFSEIMRAVTRFAADGGLVLGVCNGFQILTEARLLPGVLRPNVGLAFICRDSPLEVKRTDTAFTSRCTPGQTLTVPIKHGDGCWYADADTLAGMEENRQIVLSYRDGANPNGSTANVAGIINRDGNVFGLMPHPEHAVDSLCGSTDGALILGSFLDAAVTSGVVA
jgi:phosphoribosylformylglycinamidine synthase